MAKKKQMPTTATAESATAHHAELMARVASVDPHVQPAFGVRPLFRMRLVNPTTVLGYPLIDVVAICEAAEREGEHLGCRYFTLAFSPECGWVHLGGLYGMDLIDLLECYEVVQ